MKTQKRPLPMSKRQMLGELRAFVNLCLASIDEPDDKEIANMMGVSSSTVHRLRVGEYSLCVRQGTIQALGQAAGYGLTLNRKTAKMYVLS